MTKFPWAQPPEPIPDEKIVRHEQADVIIIGAGHAGTCAARASAEAGVSVIVLEQQGEESSGYWELEKSATLTQSWQAKHAYCRRSG